MNKPDNKTSVVTCFFDIETGGILWAVKSFGIADGMGFSKHWAVGMIRAVQKAKDKVIQHKHFVMYKRQY